MTNDEAARVLGGIAVRDPEAREALRLAIAALQPWRPIAEAPRDGTRFLAYLQWDNGSFHEVAQYEGDELISDAAERPDIFPGLHASAWALLPPPPEAMP